MNRFLRHMKVMVLLAAMRVFARLPGIGKQSRSHASQIVFRREPVRFFGLSGFEGISLLYLTDPHIGGNIDAIAHETSHAIQMLLANAAKETTIVLHGGDFMSSNGHPKALSFENFVHVGQKLFSGLA